MSGAAPIIYSPPQVKQRLKFVGRAIALLIALVALAPLVVASNLTPNHSGMETHLALRLFPCEFLRVTGLPCPSCGMTTSFAWFVRGNWLASFYVQPMGFILALLCAMIFWSGLFIAL